MTDQVFKQLVYDQALRQFGKLSVFIEQLMEFDRANPPAVGFTDQVVRNRLRKSRTGGFNDQQRRRIEDFFSERGEPLHGQDKTANSDIRNKLSGTYLLIFDQNKDHQHDPPERVHGRFAEISPSEREASKYRSISLNREKNIGNIFSGEMGVVFCRDPQSVLMIMNEHGYGVPDAFLMLSVPIDDETVFYGNCMGLNGSNRGETVAVRAIGIPVSWVSDEFEDPITPNSISSEAFDLIAGYLRQDSDQGNARVTASTLVNTKWTGSTDIAEFFRDIRLALSHHFG